MPNSGQRSQLPYSVSIGHVLSIVIVCARPIGAFDPTVVTRGRAETARSGKISIAGQVPTGLHLSIGCTAGTAVDDIAVVAEDACELLCDVRATVSTACACC